MSDFRLAIRQLLKNPGFSIVAVLTLACGIGANTAIFSLLNAVWLSSLPVRNPHELRIVNWSGNNAKMSNYSGGLSRKTGSGALTDGSFPYPLYQDFKREMKGRSDVFAFFRLDGLTVSAPSGTTTTGAMMVSSDFFDGYGAKPFIGRSLVPQDDSPQAAPVAVITYRFWEKIFSLDPRVLGQGITINQHLFTIIGVLPREFCGPEIDDAANIYVPMSAQSALSSNLHLDAIDHWWVKIMVRLDPQTKETQVAAAMKVLFQQTLSAPGQMTRIDNPNILLKDGSRGLLGVRRQMALGIILIMGAVGLVMIIACANLAGLLLARGAARQHELSVRAALGAGRGVLIRQLLTESLLLSLAGGGIGCLLAVWIKSAVLGFIPDVSEGFRIQVGMDLKVFLFVLGSALLTSLLFGLLPALRATRVDLCSGLKSRQVSATPNLRLGKTLVVGQVSLSVLLIVASGLLLQTLINLHRIDLGFKPNKVLVFGLNTGQAGLDGSARIEFYNQVHSAAEALPGVQSVSMSSECLLGGRRSANSFTIPSRQKPLKKTMQADVMTVSEDFFKTMSIPLLRGRAFERIDAASESRVAIVNRAFVKSCFPNEDPIGQSFRMNVDTDYRIVGVCGDAKYDRPQRTIEPTMYLFHRQSNPGAMFFEVRTAMEPLALVPNIRKIVTNLNSAIPLEHVSTQSKLWQTSITPERIFTSLCGGLAVLGIVLSCIGLYGLLAYMVERRTGEIGLRLALGAQRANIAKPVIMNALRLASFGLLIGIVFGLGLTQVLQSVLFGVSPYEPIALMAAALLVLSVAVLAAWLPARKAIRVDPIVALRME